MPKHRVLAIKWLLNTHLLVIKAINCHYIYLLPLITINGYLIAINGNDLLFSGHLVATRDQQWPSMAA